MRLLAVLVAAQVLCVANANLIAVALPRLGADLAATATERQWIVDAFVVVFAALLIPAGVFADRHGRRRMLLLGLGAFTVGSAACALATSPGVLIAARVLQAIGPPVVVPASLSIVAQVFSEPAARARAIGIWGGGSGFGVAIGPVAGGLVVSGLGWRWTFGLSAIAAAALVLAVLRVVPRDAGATDRPRFDGAGAALIVAVLGLAVFALIEGPPRGWTSLVVLASAAGAVACAVAFAVVERRHPAPLVDLDVLRIPVFAGANLAAATVLFVLLAMTVLLSVYLQAERGLGPLETGLALFPLGGAMALSAPVSGLLTARVPARTLILIGLCGCAAGTLLISLAGPADGLLVVVLGLLLFGAGGGLALPASTSTALSSTPAGRTGMASAIHNAGRQVGATLGVAVLGSVAASSTAAATGVSVALAVATGVLLAAAAAVARTVPRSRRT